MLKSFLLITLILSIAGCGGKPGQETPAPGAKAEAAKPAAEALKPQTLCPVMANPIDKNIFVDFQGQRVYFCDNGCAAAFSKDPETYMAKMEQDKVLLESIQTTCPVMGGAIDKKFFRDYKGRRVYFCCPGCLPAFDKDPETYLKKLPGISATPPAADPHAGHNHG